MSFQHPLLVWTATSRTLGRQVPGLYPLQAAKDGKLQTVLKKSINEMQHCLSHIHHTHSIYIEAKPKTAYHPIIHQPTWISLHHMQNNEIKYKHHKHTTLASLYSSTALWEAYENLTSGPNSGTMKWLYQRIRQSQHWSFPFIILEE